MQLGYLGAVILLAGCCSTDSTEVSSISLGYSQRNYTNIKPPGKDPTLTWYHSERGGAAYREEAYRHVLAARNATDLADHASEPTFTAHAAAAVATVTHSYSIYETQRWERFCGAGKMDIEDWDFVAQEGRSNVPAELEATCTPPAFTRQEFLEAWKATCAGGTPTPAQEHIRNATVAPDGICNT